MQAENTFQKKPGNAKLTPFKVPKEFQQQKIIKQFRRNITRRVGSSRSEGKNDAVIAITGDPGSGKSTLMLLLCKMFDKKFTLDRNVIYSPGKDEITDKILTELPPGAAVGLDEAVKALHKHKWNTASVRFLTEFFNICRKKRKIVIMCIPRFKDLPEYFRNDRVFFRIHVVKRGEAAFFVRLPTPYGTGGWHWDKIGVAWEKWIKHKSRISERPIPEEVFQFFKQRDPTYLDRFTFPMLPIKVEEEYEERVDAHKFELAEVDGLMGTDKRYYDGFVNIIKYLYETHGLSISQICRIAKTTKIDATQKMLHRRYLKEGIEVLNLSSRRGINKPRALWHGNQKKPIQDTQNKAVKPKSQ